MLGMRAVDVGISLAPDPFVFSDAPDASEPWRPMMVTQHFGRLASELASAT